jgi:acyl carrier protein
MTQPTQVFDSTTLADMLHEYFQLPLDELRPTTSFGDLGLDSLGMMEFAVALEDRTGVEFGDRLDGLSTANTLGKVAEIIGEVVAGGSPESGSPGFAP